MSEVTEAGQREAKDYLELPRSNSDSVSKVRNCVANLTSLVLSKRAPEMVRAF